MRKRVPTASAGTLLFDGHCGFCSAAARAARRRLPAAVEVVPWQAADLDALGTTAAEAERALQWVGADGTRAAGHLAVAAALRAARGGWRVLGAVLAAPLVSPVAAAVYRLVAANRGRIPGRWRRAC